jgi:2-oxoglutarate decarboxylase
MSSNTSGQTREFGPNLWLVDELYHLFLENPAAVDESWHEFFADYRPSDAVMAGDVVGDLGSSPEAAPASAPHEATQDLAFAP